MAVISVMLSTYQWLEQCMIITYMENTEHDTICDFGKYLRPVVTVFYPQ